MHKSFFLFFCICFSLNAQTRFTKQDRIRGSITPERSWWDVQKYTLNINVFPKSKSITGSNTISYKILSSNQTLQFELQDPLVIDSIVQEHQKLTYSKIGISYFVKLIQKQNIQEEKEISIYYHGKPKEAVNPPWDGGFIWNKDNLGNSFIATANQAIGASVWWPCKDHPADEAEAMSITVTCPTPLINISNGKCINVVKNDNNTTSYTWEVKNPINAYGISLNIAKYTHFSEIFKGLQGTLFCNYYVLPYNLDKAKTQFKDVKKALTAFEYWLGPYPFYTDGYKLVEVPYLGMEHQSCIGYGNHFKNGYTGQRIGASNWSKKFDYIIVHESGHEWFANSITHKDVADLWIHEAFTTYAESLFIDYYYGTEAANEYVQGIKTLVVNDKPIVGKHNVHNQGSTDMYFKGSLMLHTLRQIVNNDVLWRAILMDLNKTYYHKTVSGDQIINFINLKIPSIDLRGFFYQYLNTINIPKLVLKQNGNSIQYKWNNVVNHFKMPIKIYLGSEVMWLNPSASRWQILTGKINNLRVDPNFYIHF